MSQDKRDPTIETFFTVSRCAECDVRRRTRALDSAAPRQDPRPERGASARGRGSSGRLC
jgi:hypothetical protein